MHTINDAPLNMLAPQRQLQSVVDTDSCLRCDWWYENGVGYSYDLLVYCSSYSVCGDKT